MYIASDMMAVMPPGGEPKVTVIGSATCGCPALNAETTNINHKLLIQLHMCFHLVRRIGGERGTQRWILIIVARHGRITQRRLMDILNIRSASLSEILGKMEAAGHIARERDPADRRRTEIILTEAGQAFVQRWHKQMVEWTDLAFSSFSEAEKETFSALLDRLLTDWQTMADERETPRPPGGISAAYGPAPETASGASESTKRPRAKR